MMMKRPTQQWKRSSAGVLLTVYWSFVVLKVFGFGHVSGRKKHTYMALKLCQFFKYPVVRIRLFITPIVCPSVSLYAFTICHLCLPTNCFLSVSFYLLFLHVFLSVLSCVLCIYKSRCCVYCSRIVPKIVLY